MVSWLPDNEKTQSSLPPTSTRLDFELLDHKIHHQNLANNRHWDTPSLKNKDRYEEYTGLPEPKEIPKQ